MRSSYSKMLTLNIIPSRSKTYVSSSLPILHLNHILILMVHIAISWLLTKECDPTGLHSLITEWIKKFKKKIQINNIIYWAGFKTLSSLPCSLFGGKLDFFRISAHYAIKIKKNADKKTTCMTK